MLLRYENQKKINLITESRRSLIGLSDWSYDFKTGYTTWVGDKRRKTILDPMCILY